MAAVRAQQSAAIRPLCEHSSDIGSVYGQCVIQNMVKCVVMQILIIMAVTGRPML